jgi:alpha-tubulin suppressor-like RCC1 family protein
MIHIRRFLLGVLALAVLMGVGVQAAQAQAATVYRWGSYHTVGFGAGGPQGVPTIVPGLSDVVALAAGNSASYALLANGQEWAWGNNGYGQLGNHSRVNSLVTPVQVAFPTGVVITAIGEADDMAYAVDSTGHGWSWGWNGQGGLCLGNHKGRDVPTRIPGLSNLIAVKGGGGVDIWLTSGGAVYSCGATFTGHHASPVQVTGFPAGDPVVAISAGNAYSTALTASGQIWDWGLGIAGQLGNGLAQTSPWPVQVTLPAGTYATQVYSGGDLGNDGHQLAVLNTGTVVSWGSNVCGQLGSGSAHRASTPVTVSVLHGMSVQSVAAGGSTSYVLDTSGNLWAWGSNNGGQVRQPSSRCAGPPTKVDSGVSLISATASDVLDYHS